MKTLLLFFALISVILFSPNTAQADTDYRCLKLCVAQGNTYYTCNPRCGLGQAEGNKKEEKDLLVKTPLPWESARKQKVFSTKNNDLENDYLCLKTCLNNRLQYSFCTKKCTKMNEKN